MIQRMLLLLTLNKVEESLEVFWEKEEQVVYFEE